MVVSDGSLHLSLKPKDFLFQISEIHTTVYSDEWQWGQSTNDRKDMTFFYPWRIAKGCVRTEQIRMAARFLPYRVSQLLLPGLFFATGDAIIIPSGLVTINAVGQFQELNTCHTPGGIIMLWYKYSAHPHNEVSMWHSLSILDTDPTVSSLVSNLLTTNSIGHPLNHNIVFWLQVLYQWSF